MPSFHPLYELLVDNYGFKCTPSISTVITKCIVALQDGLLNNGWITVKVRIVDGDSGCLVDSA